MPSKQYPGKYHTWELTALLQVGSNRNLEQFKERLLSITRLWRQALPSVLIGQLERDPREIFLRASNAPILPTRFYSGLSARVALGHLWEVGVELVDSLVGVARYESPASFDECKAELQDLKHKLAAMEPYIFTLKDPPLANFLRVNAGYYMRSPAIMNADRIRLEKIRADLTKAWREIEQGLRAKWTEEIQSANPGLSAEEVLDKVQDRAAQEQQAMLFDMIRQQPQHLSSPNAIIDTAIAFATLEFEQEQLQRERAAFEKKCWDEEKKAHPFLARDLSLLQHSIDKKLFAFDTQHQYAIQERAAAKLTEQKLNQEAYLLRHNAAFRQNVLPQLKAKAWEQRQPKVIWEEERRIWLATNWRKEYDDRRNIWRLTSKYEDKIVGASFLFCRFWLFAVAYFTYVSNAAFGLWVMMFHGPLSLRALFGCSNYHYIDDISKDTGEPIPGDRHITPFAMYLREIWTSVAESRAEFEALPDVGFLGKSCMRVFNVFWNYIIVGLCGTLLVVLFMPVLCIGSFFLSLVLLVACPVWVPVWLVVARVWQLVVYNKRAMFKWFPLITLMLYAVFQLLLLVICLLIVVSIPLFSLLILLWGALVYVLRGVWDTIMYYLVISPRARIPAADSFVAKRIAGPGLTEHYYYSIQVSDVLLVLQVQLEKYEMEFYRQWIQEFINKPKAEFNAFVAEALKPVGTLFGQYRSCVKMVTWAISANRSIL